MASDSNKNEKHPKDFTDNDWQRLDWPSTIRTILTKYPEYAHKVQNWDRMIGISWERLLEKQPQLHIYLKDWNILDGDDLVALLVKDPTFIEHVVNYDWDKLSDGDWDVLSNEHPQFEIYKLCTKL